MEDHYINWTDVYQSLNTEAVKASGKWMFLATLVAGMIILLIFILIFRKNPVVIVFMVVGVIMFSGKYAVGLWRMSKQPEIFSGIVIAKSVDSFTDESTMTSYATHYIIMKVESETWLTEAGPGALKIRDGKRRKIKCPEDLYNTLTEGDNITIVVMPHDKTIAWSHIKTRQ